jgi:hypothetical protein
VKTMDKSAYIDKLMDSIDTDISTLHVAATLHKAATPPYVFPTYNTTKRGPRRTKPKNEERKWYFRVFGILK